MGTLVTLVFWLLIATSTLTGAEDSLQGALKAVHRRQRDLTGYSRYDNNWDDYSDIAKYESRKAELEKALYEYLENAQDYDDEYAATLSTSPFRERLNAKAKPQRNFRREDDDVEFLSRNDVDDSEPVYTSLAPYKRANYYNYNSLGYNGVGLRKRRPYSHTQRAHSAIYDDDYSYGPYGVFKSRARRVPFYPVTKRFPVAKRSMEEPGDVFVQGQPFKVAKRTDPKVEKELSQLFNAKAAKPGKEAQNGPKEDKSKGKTAVESTKKPIGKAAVTVAPSAGTTAAPKEGVRTQLAAEEKPLQMSKKSVKWSDYFGIDRRKKSMDNMDNEWLLDRYHKAVELGKEKKSEYPLKSFRRHDASGGRGDEQRPPGSMEELDEKLKTIEESIIDDTLKLTGASGAQDDLESDELKDAKDGIISRLATAYNIEKMRKALREYRRSLAARHAIEEVEDNAALADDDIVEEKRVAVPRKQAVDADHQRRDADEDNNIKCTANDENCVEQNYKVPREFMEQATFEKGGCERIERACREVSLILGPYGTVFETACNMHQMCMLCSDNSWFSPTRQCNILFISKADQLCDGDVACQRAARESIRYLQHVDRAMRADLSIGCNLECPDRR